MQDRRGNLLIKELLDERLVCYIIFCQGINFSFGRGGCIYMCVVLISVAGVMECMSRWKQREARVFSPYMCVYVLMRESSQFRVSTSCYFLADGSRWFWGFLCLLCGVLPYARPNQRDIWQWEPAMGDGRTAWLASAPLCAPSRGTLNSFMTQSC